MPRSVEYPIPTFQPDNRTSSTFALSGLHPVGPNHFRASISPEGTPQQFASVVSDTLSNIWELPFALSEYAGIPLTDENALIARGERLISIRQGANSNREIPAVYATDTRNPPITFIPFPGSLTRIVSGDLLEVQFPDNSDIASDSIPMIAELEGEIFIIFPEGDMFRYDNGRALDLEPVSNLKQQLTTEQRIQAVHAWQGRIFAAVGNRLLWTRAFSPHQWSSTNRSSDNTADADGGFNDLTSGDINDIVSIDKSLIIFTQRDIQHARAASSDYSFVFRSLATGVQAVPNSALEHHGDIYFMSRDSVRRIPAAGSGGGGLETLSTSIDLQIINPSDVSVTSTEEYVIWGVSSKNLLVYYSTKWGTMHTEAYDIAHVTTYNRGDTTINQINAPINSISIAINDLGASRAGGPIAIDTSGRFTPIEIAQRHVLEFNLGTDDPTKQMYIQRIAFPELDNYEVSLKERTSAVYEQPIPVNRHGQVGVFRGYRSPDIRLVTTDQVQTLTKVAIQSRMRHV